MIRKYIQTIELLLNDDIFLASLIMKKSIRFFHSMLNFDIMLVVFVFPFHQQIKDLEEHLR